MKTWNAYLSRMLKKATLFAGLLVLIIGCNNGTNEPYTIRNEKIGVRITFPQYPYKQAEMEQPYRFMAETATDSIGYWFNITQHGKPFSEDVRENALEELQIQLEDQQFEEISRIDSTIQSLPFSIVRFENTSDVLYQWIVFKDSVIISPSVLMSKGGALQNVESYFSSLELNYTPTAVAED